MTQNIEIPEHYAVLIVDDNEADRYLLRRLLRRAGLGDRHFEVTDGEDALRFFADPPQDASESPGVFPPFLVFVDVNMPRMNGFEFLEAFAKQHASLGHPTSYFLMVSSSRREDDARESEKFDFVRGYIEKYPSTAEELRREVTLALGAS